MVITMDIEQYKFTTELHLHTSPASTCSDIPPVQAVEIYKALGYDSIVVCNHFDPHMPLLEDKKACIKRYLTDYYETLEAGRALGVHVIFGCELRFFENVNDYLLFGVDESILDFAYDYMPKGIEAFSKDFRREDRLLIQAHPFRNNMTRIDPALLDGIETFNMHPNHNSRVALADQYAREHHLIPTVGSDFHHPGHEGVSALLTKTELRTSQDIVNVLRSGDYLFRVGRSIVLP